jgi:proliferating cell nuclear antigen
MCSLSLSCSGGLKMKLTLAENAYLKDSITIISDLVTEARFKINKDAIELIAMDPANVAMVVFKLLGSCFAEYEVEKEVEISLNLANLKQVLRRAKADDVITIELSSENRLKLQLKSKTTRTFYLPLIDIEEKEQKIPDLNFPITVKLPSSTLNETIDDVDIVAESVTFVAEKNKFTVLGEGDLSKVNVEIPKGDDVNIAVDTDDIVKAKYSIEYLKKMILGSKLSPEVTIQFNKDYPLKIEYKAVDKVLLAFILAPRVEND